MNAIDEGWIILAPQMLVPACCCILRHNKAAAKKYFIDVFRQRRGYLNSRRVREA